ncbi:MAG: hypothetical protein ACREI3_07225 [Nitrospirales bacterium]
MEATEALDLIGSLVSSLKTYAAKLPAVSHMVMPGGIKPAPEAVEAYEQAVLRYRKQAGTSPYRRVTDALMESLEAFEGGRLLAAVQPLLMSLDLFDLMQREQVLKLTPAEEKRVGEYRMALQKILPGKDPELKGAGKGL